MSGATSEQILALLLARANKIDASLSDHDARLGALEKQAPPVVRSDDLTTVPPASRIVDDKLSTYTLASGKVVINSVPVANTSNVALLKLCRRPLNPALPGGVYQQAGTQWYGPVSPAGGGPAIAGDPATTPTPAPSPAPTPTPTPTPTPGGAPPQAAAAGYTTLTFGPEIVISGARQNWFPVNGVVTKNADGSVTIPGTPGYGYNALTAVLGGGTFKGTAFGGGGYFECVFKFTGPAPFGVPVPCFWANDIENQLQASYGTGQSQWPGQPAGYVDSIEWDIDEVNAGSSSMGFTVHNWFGMQSAIHDTYASRSGSPATGLGDLSQYHKIAGIWVPATATTQGFIQQYFDDRPVGNRIVWNKYDPALPPPPVEGRNAFSRIDVSHMYFIIGTGPNNPTTYQSMRVFQRSAVGNLVK